MNKSRTKEVYLINIIKFIKISTLPKRVWYNRQINTYIETQTDGRQIEHDRKN